MTTLLQRSSLRISPAAQVAWIYDDCGADAGPWHRRHHCHLQPDPGRIVASCGNRKSGTRGGAASTLHPFEFGKYRSLSAGFCRCAFAEESG